MRLALPSWRVLLLLLVAVLALAAMDAFAVSRGHSAAAGFGATSSETVYSDGQTVSSGVVYGP